MVVAKSYNYRIFYILCRCCEMVRKNVEGLGFERCCMTVLLLFIIIELLSRILLDNVVIIVEPVCLYCNHAIVF